MMSTRAAIQILVRAHTRHDELTGFIVRREADLTGVTPSDFMEAWGAMRRAVNADVDLSANCTCHPDDNPPRPCPGRRALAECRRAAGQET